MLRQQEGINADIRQLQQLLLTLQNRIQDQLAGDVVDRELEDLELRIVNRLDNPPIPQEEKQFFRPEPQQRPQTQQQQLSPPEFQQQQIKPPPPQLEQQQPIPPQFQQQPTPPQIQQATQQPPAQSPPNPNQPQQILDEPVIPCSTLSGEAGSCRPLIKCLSFYAELPELKKQPCQLEGGLGVCCPRRNRPTGECQSSNF